MYIDTREMNEIFDRDLVTFEEFITKMLDMKVEIDSLKEKNEDLEYINEDLKYENEHLLEELKEKQERINELLEETNTEIENNPYLHYGVSESDFH